MSISGVTPVILGFLSLGARSGYEIKAAVDRSTRFFWAASYGQIYPELRRLERDGLIEGESSPTGARPRTVYRLTERGTDALRAWLLAPDVGYELRDLGLLKLFFADNLEREEVLELVRAIRTDRERVLERLRAIDASIPAGPRDMRGAVLEYGLGKHEWIVEWCKALERRLEQEQERTKARKGTRVA